LAWWIATPEDRLWLRAISGHQRLLPAVRFGARSRSKYSPGNQ
jgi:hypothetical protein